ncbi:Transposon Ty3-G Gag-Pol poly, partial [Paramuricea clavata]
SEFAYCSGICRDKEKFSDNRISIQQRKRKRSHTNVLRSLIVVHLHACRKRFAIFKSSSALNLIAVCRHNIVQLTIKLDLLCARFLFVMGEIVVESIEAEPWKANLTVNDCKFQFKLDSGADVTVVPKYLYDKLSNKRKVKLQSTDKILLGPCNYRLNCLGKFNARITSKNKFILEEIYVVKDLRKPLLGKSACVSLNLLDKTKKEIERIYTKTKWGVDFTLGKLSKSKILFGTRILIPSCMRLNVLDKIHEGHLGITKCRERAKQSVWWPGLSTQIQDMVQHCRTCAMHMVNKPEPLFPTSFPERPWQTLAIDFFKCENIDYLIVVDYFSRGDPKYPQSNGEVERAVQTIKRLLKKEKDKEKALLAYRSTPLSCGYSPAELLMGRKIPVWTPCIRNGQIMRHKAFDTVSTNDINLGIKVSIARNYIKHNNNVLSDEIHDLFGKDPVCDEWPWHQSVRGISVGGTVIFTPRRKLIVIFTMPNVKLALYRKYRNKSQLRKPLVKSVPVTNYIVKLVLSVKRWMTTPLSIDEERQQIGRAPKNQKLHFECINNEATCMLPKHHGKNVVKSLRYVYELYA